MREIGYNSQRDNFTFEKKFSGWCQCFSTCAFMLMSYYDDRISADNDAALAVYVDDVEDTVGKPGIAETIKKKYRWITGRTSYFWQVHQAAINSWLHAYDVKGECVLYDCNFRISNLAVALHDGPIIIGTQKLGGLSNGHIILLVDYTDDNEFIVNDPFGNATTNYKDADGNAVKYGFDYLLPHITTSPGFCRVLLWKK